MTPLDTIATLARGTRPAAGLLHNCRLEGHGTEFYGIESIVERFAAAPLDFANDPRIVESPSHMAVFEGTNAIFADLCESNVVRLWLLGGECSAAGEPGISVPFDPDLAQVGGDVFFAAEDHPDLAEEAAPRVAMLGRAVVAEAAGRRVRAFAIRAFGNETCGAALFSVFRLGIEDHVVAGFTLMASWWDSDGHCIVQDRGSEAGLAASNWTPRVVA